MKQEEILQQVKDGRLSIEEASTLLKGIEDIGYAAIDLSRQKRNGFPEIIYGEGKNIEQLIGIITAMNEHKTAILATRVNAEKGEALSLAFPEGVYEPLGRTSSLTQSHQNMNTTSQSLQRVQATFLLPKKRLSLRRHSEITSNVFTTSELREFTASSIVSKTSKALAS